MSNRRRLKPGRSLEILLARAQGETAPGQVSIAHIYHDEDCPALTRQSMLMCDCRPEIVIEPAA